MKWYHVLMLGNLALILMHLSTGFMTGVWGVLSVVWNVAAVSMIIRK
jgi:fructose-1,6-bisphosphatase/inositol monophosphatase family enzyme